MVYLTQDPDASVSRDHDRLVEILDNLPYGLFTTDEKHRINYFNSAAERIMGLSASGAIGALCKDVFTNSMCEADCVFRKDSLPENDLQSREFETTNAEGKRFPIIYTTTALRDRGGKVIGRMHVFKDISDRKRLEEYLKLSKDKYRHLFENSKDMIFVTSKGSLFFDFNQAFVETLGYDAKEEIWSLASVERVYTNPLHRKVFQEQIDRYGFVKDFETSFQKKDGSRIHCLVSGNAVRDLNGNVIGYEAIAKDITARMEGVRNLHQQHRELSLIHAVAVAMNVTCDLSDVLNIALKKVLEVLNIGGGGIFLIERGKPPFSLMAQRGLPNVVLGRTHQLVFHDRVLMRSLLESECSLRPQLAFPPFKATLKGLDEEDGSVSLTCFLFTTKDRPSGFLAFWIPPNKEISDHDHHLIGSLGNFLGSAIDNASMLQTIREHREELKELTARLFHSQEEERKRIARELHDEAGQALTGVKFTLELVERGLPPNLDQVREHIEDIKKRIGSTYQEMRRISHRLHPVLLSDLGLEPALEACLSSVSKFSPMEMQFKMVGFEERLDPEMEIIIFRISQEALTNALKHSGANQFKLSLIKSYPHIILLAEDDGVGFDPQEFDERKQALGLLSMRERASMLGGKFTLRTAKGRGVRIRIEIPVRKEDSDDA
jgi:PAS domain S-box-containing protein